MNELLKNQNFCKFEFPSITIYKMGGFLSKVLQCDVRVEEEDRYDYSSESHKALFTTDANKRGLVIGINYDHDNVFDDDLRGCVNDMNNLRQFLIKYCHFQNDEIRTLCNERATRKNIERSLLQLVSFSHANPRSEIWLSYSGHGTSVPCAQESDGCSEVICPSDYSKSGLISDAWLQRHFVSKLHPSTKVFVLMDCCNSGTNLNLPYIYQHEDVCSSHSDYTAKELQQLCTIVKMSGCRDDQTSADYFESYENEFQGALTNGFLHFADLSEMEDEKHILQYYKDVLGYVTYRGFSQRPVLTFSRCDLLNCDLYER